MRLKKPTPQRSAIMRAIKGKGTKPERETIKILKSLGERPWRNVKRLPGRPDVVYGKRVAIFVHGCFWHGHRCPHVRPPKTNAEYWKAKIRRNKARDARSLRLLRAAGWTAMVVWECHLRGFPDIVIDNLKRALEC